MPKNIVVFADGTGQAGGVRAEQRLSNIYKLYRASNVGPDNDIDPAEQVAYYDAGLGTDDDVTALTSVARRAKKWLGLITGRGMTTNIIDCYQFIINHYQPGDRIFLFGFSRGAYTVRRVSNVLSLCGVPTMDAGGLRLPIYRARVREIAAEAVREVYEHGQSHERAKYEAERDEKGRRFRAKYGSAVGEIPNAGTYFIGIFDAVAALGTNGMRRTVIVLLLLAAFLGLMALLGWAAAALLDVSFFVAFGALTSLLGALTLRKIHKSRLREIRDFPSPGDVKRHTVAWRGDEYDGSLSRRVMYARHAISIDERRADFARVKWAIPQRYANRPMARHSSRSSSCGSPATTRTLAAAIPKPSPACRTSACSGWSSRQLRSRTPSSSITASCTFTLRPTGCSTASSPPRGTCSKRSSRGGSSG
jgi:hypothetical protein